MTIVLDVSFNDHQQHQQQQQQQSNNDSQQHSAINDISSRKAKDKRNSSPTKASKVAKVKNKVSVNPTQFMVN